MENCAGVLEHTHVTRHGSTFGFMLRFKYHSGLQRLVLFASKLVFVLQGEGGSLLLLSIALLGLPQP